jgi:SUN domain-containing protein 1/2
MLIGRVCGTAFEVVFSRPGRWLAGSAGFVKVLVVLAVGALVARYVMVEGQVGGIGRWIPSSLPSLQSIPLPSFPSLSRSYQYDAPSIPASTIAELSARLQAIENALSGLSIDHERSRSKLDTEAKTRAELVGRLGSLETRIQQEGSRALEAEEQYRVAASLGLEAVRKEVEVLQKQLVVQGSRGGGEHGDDEESKARLKALEERVGSVEGGVKEALEMGRHSVKAGGGAAWWNKLTSGTAGTGLTIRSSDGQDVSSIIGHLVDSAVSQYGKDNVARADYALHSSGAKTIPSLTSPTFEIRPSSIRGHLVGLVTGNGYAIGRPPVTALHHELHNGHCWPFKGTEGQLAVALAAPTYIDAVTIDHVAKEVAFDMRSAPREMEVWGMVEGKDNVGKVRKWLVEKRTRREAAKKLAKVKKVPFVEDPRDMEIPLPRTLPKSPQYIRIANFTYNIHSPQYIQTFPVDEEIRELGVDFGIVVLRVKSNWGRDEYTCLYRFRAHGQRMGEIPVPHPEDYA